MAARDLPERHAASWRAATSHPFLDGIRDGGLPVDAFARWLTQDHLFVGDLLTFQALLMARAPRSAQKVLAAGLVALEAELTWFESHAAARGIVLSTARHPTTEAYRAELGRLQQEPFEVAMTALWALELAYLEAWRAAAPGVREYRDYVEHWTAPEFAGYVAALEAQASDSPAAEAAWLRIAALERDFWGIAVAPK